MYLDDCPFRFDADLNSCKEDANSEVIAKEQLAKEKDKLHTEHEELKAKHKVCVCDMVGYYRVSPS